MTVLVEMFIGLAVWGREVAVKEVGIELAGRGGRAGGSFSNIAFRFRIVPLKVGDIIITIIIQNAMEVISLGCNRLTVNIIGENGIRFAVDSAYSP